MVGLESELIKEWRAAREYLAFFVGRYAGKVDGEHECEHEVNEENPDHPHCGRMGAKLSR